MGVSENGGVPYFGDPHNKDPTRMGTILYAALLELPGRSLWVRRGCFGGLRFEPFVDQSLQAWGLRG